MIRHRILIAGLAAILALSSASAQDQPIPDFSGIWARTTFGYDLAASGPGPLKNLERRGTRSGSVKVGDYNNPILKPWAAEMVRQHGVMSKTQGGYPDLSNNCRPLPPPYILRVARMQMLQERDQVTLLYTQNHMVRRVRMNGTHPANVKPTPFGDSIGRYEGGTLVIDTIGIKTGPGSMIDMYGTPYTEALHVVERYRLIDGEAARLAQDLSEKEYGRPNTEPVYVDFNYKGKGLEVQFTVEDEGAFTKPWSSRVTYRRSANDWEEIVCAENTFEYYSNSHTDVPTDDTPDF